MVILTKKLPDEFQPDILSDFFNAYRIALFYNFHLYFISFSV